MADDGISAPLLAPDHLILTLPERSSTHSIPTDNAETLIGAANPFRSLGCHHLYVPPPSTVDPFRNNTPAVDGLYECLKILVLLPIALLRLLLFGVSLSLGYVATRLALQAWKDTHNPMPNWRCRLMCVTRFCGRAILFSFGYQWIRRKGRPAPREIAPIIVSNHVSYIDPIFFFYELFPTIVASESHDSLPFVGTIIRAMQVVYVNRFSPSSRKQAVHEIKDVNNREGLLAIDFLEYFCFLKEPLLMGKILSPFNLVHLFMVTQFSL